MSSQKKYRNVSTDSNGQQREASDDGFYQGMLKSMDGRKGMTDLPRAVGQADRKSLS